MSIRRILKVAGRDIRSTSRDFMNMYILFAPFLLAIILFLVTPDQDELNVKFVLEETIEQAVIDDFVYYGSVELVPTEQDVRDRVDQTDEIIGLIYESGTFKTIVQGNETEGYKDLPNMILNNHFNEPGEVVNVTLENAGRETSIVRREGSLFIMLFVFAIPGVLVGLNIVEEKESNTISALSVTPLRKDELMIGKSVFGTFISFIQMYAVFFIFQYTYVDWWMLTLLYVPSILAGLLIGYIIGAIASDQIAALGLVKFTFMPLIASMMGTLFIPRNWWWTLYWSPYHWLYRITKGMIMETIDWKQFGIWIAITMGLSIFYIIVGRKKALSAIK